MNPLPLQNPCYQAVKSFYGSKTAKRSKVPLINHIDEGLKIMAHRNVSHLAQAAYCLHPLVQSDDALSAFVANSGDSPAWGLQASGASMRALALALEYRRVANSYLSKNGPGDLVTTPIRDVWEMLLADKVQNRKDFMMHHQGTHPRSTILAAYFDTWVHVILPHELGITSADVFHLHNLISLDNV